MVYFQVKKIIHYSSTSSGGAARAAFRINEALQRHQDIDSSIVTLDTIVNDHRDPLPYRSFQLIRSIIMHDLDCIPRKLARYHDLIPRSINFLGIVPYKKINTSPSDIVHLHWIGNSFISIFDIPKITKPIVWTLHDMWAFCGAEHLSTDAKDSRWLNGYNRLNNLKSSSFDLDRLCWSLKYKIMRKVPIHLVTPSSWLTDCTKKSKLFSHMQVHTIANPVNIDVFSPNNKEFSRTLLGLPPDSLLIGFGAASSLDSANKGFDLLIQALSISEIKALNVTLVVAGPPSNKSQKDNYPIPIIFLGNLYDDYSLVSFYSAIDIMVVPSRQESFGQMASEAQACACPVVCFDTTGLKDIVIDNITGNRVPSFDTREFGESLNWLLSNKYLREKYGRNAREHAIQNFSYESVSNKYNQLYSQILDR
jgi:glycosyltransferase involved in cell wall biosynthesis